MNEPAFPNGDSSADYTTNGMTLREYACIKLKVPESADEELNELIRKSLRNDLAAKAMQAQANGRFSAEAIAKSSYVMANELLKEGEK